MVNTFDKEYDKMSNMNDKMMKFSKWLLSQLNDKGISQAELARRSKIKNRQNISNYINVKVDKPDEEILSQIAIGLNLPVSTVFQAAGIMKSESNTSPIIDEAVYLIEGLPEDFQIDVLEYIRHRQALAEKRGKSENKKRVTTIRQG